MFICYTYKAYKSKLVFMILALYERVAKLTSYSSLFFLNVMAVQKLHARTASCILIFTDVGFALRALLHYGEFADVCSDVVNPAQFWSSWGSRAMQPGI